MTESPRTWTDEAELVRRVELLVELRKLDRAGAALAEGLRKFPENLRLLFLSAYIDWVEDNNEACRATLERLLTLSPEDYSGRTLLAQLQEEENHLADAELTWIALLRDYPEDAELYAHYGDLMLRTLHLHKARKLVQQGLRLEPDNPHCLFVQALCDIVDGRPLDNNASLAALIRHHPGHYRSGIALVYGLIDRRRDRAALDVAQEMLRAEPSADQLVELVRSLKQRTHWSMLPLYPVHRWGWPASLGMWAVVAFGLPVVAPNLPPGISGGFVISWFVYVAYSWAWPPLARKVLR